MRLAGFQVRFSDLNPECNSSFFFLVLALGFNSMSVIFIRILAEEMLVKFSLERIPRMLCEDGFRHLLNLHVLV